jgi:hypothetical protein
MYAVATSSSIASTRTSARSCAMAAANAARAGADVDHERVTARRRRRQQRQRPLGERLGLRTRHEDTAREPHADVEEVLPATDQLQRLAGGATVHDAAVARRECGIERAIADWCGLL